MIVSLRQARIAEQQRAVAEQRFNDIRTVSHDLIFQIHDSIQFLPGATPGRKLVVQSALGISVRSQKMLPATCRYSRKSHRPMKRVGNVHGGIGSANTAVTPQER